jgi:hypothetical protein
VERTGVVDEIRRAASTPATITSISRKNSLRSTPLRLARCERRSARDARLESTRGAQRRASLADTWRSAVRNVPPAATPRQDKQNGGETKTDAPPGPRGARGARNLETPEVQDIVADSSDFKSTLPICASDRFATARCARHTDGLVRSGNARIAREFWADHLTQPFAWCPPSCTKQLHLGAKTVARVHSESYDKYRWLGP